MAGTHREGYVSVSFTSIPEEAYERFKAEARKAKRATGVHVFPRDIFTDAIRQLLADREAGQPIVYHASRKGGVRRALWLEEDLVAGMREAAGKDQVTQTEFFLTALKRYAGKEGLNVEM